MDRADDADAAEQPIAATPVPAAPFRPHHTRTQKAILTLNVGNLVDGIKHLILPSVALATIPMAVIARITRSSLLDVLGSDYIRTARAKGLSEREVVSKHALRNALLPVATVVGLSLGGLLSGAVLTETVFGFAGIGRTKIGRAHV